MNCFQDDVIPHEGELLSAAVIIKDILLRLQNQKFADAMNAAAEVRTEPEPDASIFLFNHRREACV